MTRLQRLRRADPTTRQLVVILLVCFVAVALFKPATFLRPGFLINMLYLFPEYGILALAMMFPIIMGGIDLSIIATANFAGIVSCVFLKAVVPVGAGAVWAGGMLLAAVLLAMALGMLCGLIPAFLVGNLGIPPMLATLGASDLVMGLSLVLTRGTAITEIPPVLNRVGSYHILGVLPVPLLAFALAAWGASRLLSRSPYGVKLYMMGSNPTASRYSGIDNRRVTYRTFMTSGTLAAVSGMLMCAHFNSAKADLGSSYLMQSILICLLGGVNPQGGFGNVRNVVLAVGILQILSSAINMIPGISTFYRDLLWGAVLLLVMSTNHILAQRRNRKAPPVAPLETPSQQATTTKST